MRKDKKRKKDGKAPIYLRVTVDRKSRYKSSGIYIKPRHWNGDRGKVRRSHELYVAYNEKLKELRLEAEQAALDLESADAIKAQIDGEAGRFDTYLQRFIKEEKGRRAQHWERKKYRTTLRKLRATLGRDEIQWKDLTPGLLRRLQRYCLEELGNAQNTTRKELSRVRRVVKQAIADRLLDASEDPFVSFTMPNKQKVERRKLSRDEMRSMEELDLTGRLLLARDAFVFSFYAGGMRFGDVCKVRTDHIIHEEAGTRLVYSMMKTDQRVNLKLPPPAVRIVERHTNGSKLLFPFIRERDLNDPVRLRQRISSANVQLNSAIKEVAEMAGIRKPEEVSFHVARHSYADYARQSSGGDVYAVSKALGHSSIATTERYLASFDRKATDQLADSMWDDEGDE
ncbi:MAG: tyrosine-type recombinase/integrase [Bacteroidetes bacterium]|jgi:integrase|nr:tyrosine-type recombinase/integrase [Bacteroidota bacterium]